MTAMDEKDKALQLLQKAYTDHEVDMVWLKGGSPFQTIAWRSPI
jgi:hypothetical protein